MTIIFTVFGSLGQLLWVVGVDGGGRRHVLSVVAGGSTTSFSLPWNPMRLLHSRFAPYFIRQCFYSNKLVRSYFFIVQAWSWP
jgi:hypothetical protein